MAMRNWSRKSIEDVIRAVYAAFEKRTGHKPVLKKQYRRS